MRKFNRAEVPQDTQPLTSFSHTDSMNIGHSKKHKSIGHRSDLFAHACRPTIVSTVHDLILFSCDINHLV